MNLRIFRLFKVLANLNESLADELNQPTSFPIARSNKKTTNPMKPKTQSPKNPVGWIGLF